MLASLAREEPEVEEGTSRASRRDQQAHRILEAAKSCFLRAGFQGASMQHICAEAGMSPGALYRYFPSKEAIIAAIVEADRRSDAEILGSMGTGATEVGVVKAALAYIRHVHETGSAPLSLEIRAEAMRNCAVREASVRCMESAAAMFGERLGRAAARGEIDPVVPLESLVPLMMATADGIAMSNLPAQGMPWSAIETTLRAMTEALLRPRAASLQQPAA